MSVATVRKWKFAQVNDKRFYFSDGVVSYAYCSSFTYQIK